MLEIERGGPILAIAPHPDDETIGAGGLLLRASAAGREIHWLIVTTMRPEDGWPTARIESREAEIEAVARAHRADEYILPGELAACCAMLRNLAAELSTTG